MVPSRVLPLAFWYATFQATQRCIPSSVCVCASTTHKLKVKKATVHNTKALDNVHAI